MLAGIIIGQLIGAVIGSLITAIVLRAAAKWVQKIEVPYGQAYVTVLFPNLINVVLGSIVGYAVGSATQSMEAVNVTALLMIPVGFLIQSGFISSRLEIPFNRACLVVLTMAAIGIAIGIIVAIPIVLITTLIN
jgi:uncharacterized protein YacL